MALSVAALPLCPGGRRSIFQRRSALHFSSPFRWCSRNPSGCIWQTSSRSGRGTSWSGFPNRMTNSTRTFAGWSAPEARL